MKTLIFTLLLSFTALPAYFTQDMQEHDHDHAVAIRAFEASETGYLDPAVIPTGHLSVRAMDLRGFAPAGVRKLEAAFEVLEKVVNSETFKERVINFKNTKDERAFASNKGLSNEEIYEAFMEGRETLQMDTPGEMNFYLKLYNGWWSKVIGWTKADINTININYKYFKNFKPNQVAGNLAHEWVHKLGFGHISAAEHDSAPYAIGYIVEELARQVLAGQDIR